jgi:leucyl aminopeptidase
MALSFSGIKPNIEAVARAFFLTSYELDRYKTERKKSASFTLFIQGSKTLQNQIDRAQIQAESQMWAMRLVDTPPNEKGPEAIAAETEKLGKSSGFKVEVWDAEKISEEGLNALSAVGRGSSRPPVFIHCRYEGKPKSKETDLVLLGKGISFDTGGISIKPSTNLHFMKSDMAGAAAVLGALASIARIKLPINLSVIVPSAENNVATGALLPGEVIHSYSGKTIEVIDTDAEGRLVLADGIAWAVKHLKPKTMIDCATLTGSAVRALGNEAAALYSSNSKLSDKLYLSGQESGEKLWPMPLWKDYDHYLQSDIADVSNLPSKPVAGSIAAAKFLEVFTDKHSNWAHIDMPGVSFRDNPRAKTKSATGFGVQLLTNFILQEYA